MRLSSTTAVPPARPVTSSGRRGRTCDVRSIPRDRPECAPNDPRPAQRTETKCLIFYDRERSPVVKTNLTRPSDRWRIRRLTVTSAQQSQTRQHKSMPFTAVIRFFVVDAYAREGGSSWAEGEGPRAEGGGWRRARWSVSVAPQTFGIRSYRSYRATARGDLIASGHAAGQARAAVSTDSIGRREQGF